MFFVITSVIWSKLQEEHNQDNSNIFLYLIVWGWYLDAGVYSQQLKIIKRILENSQIIAWGIFSISVKMGVINTELIRIDSAFSWIVLSLITDSILSRTSFWKDGGQVVAFGMRCSAIGVVCTCIFACCLCSFGLFLPMHQVTSAKHTLTHPPTHTRDHRKQADSVSI